MGSACSLYCPHEPELVPFQDTGGEVRMLIIALDYMYRERHEQLTATSDASVMVALAERAGVTDINVVTDTKGIGRAGFPTRKELIAKIKEDLQE
ncbi:unnamed protein product [Polarella glacialis]|uniref:Uncharacterized protein n=1 Tax=Polarella glacialis TaxID=89957 RepID=A0A813LHI1_POLGL|nr:unnamed protein product [Polarella glacialis]